MTRWLIYALGGGLGHAVRGASLARALAPLGVQARVVCAEHAAPAARQLFGEVSGLRRAEHPSPEALAARLAPELERCDLLLLDTFPRGILNELQRPSSALPNVPRLLLTRLVQAPHAELQSEAGWAELGLGGVVDIEANLRWLPGPALRCGPVARRLTPAHLTPNSEVSVALSDENARKRVTGLLERCGVGYEVVDPSALASGYGARIVIGRAGYNLSYELALAGVWHVALPGERPIDDQRRRAEHLGASVHSPQALERRVRALLDAGPRRSSDVLEHSEFAARLLKYVAERELG